MININFYDGLDRLYYEQTLDIQGDYTLSELEENGLTLPTPPTLRGKTFIKWNQTSDYNFFPLFINSAIEDEYFNSKLDNVNLDINNNANNINLRLVGINDKSSKSVNNLNNIDGDIVEEINLLKQKNLETENLLDSFDNLKLDEKLIQIQDNLANLSSDIETMDINHKLEIAGIKTSILSNETKLTELNNKLATIPKHVITTESNYKSLDNPDKNIIYFTKEN